MYFVSEHDGHVSSMLFPHPQSAQCAQRSFNLNLRQYLMLYHL